MSDTADDCGMGSGERENEANQRVKAISFAVPSANAANQIANVVDSVASYPDFSKIIDANHQQFLTISESVKQAMLSACDYAPILDSIKELASEYTARTLAITEAMQPTLESTQAIAAAAKQALDGVRVYAPAILDIMSSVSETYAEYLDISSQLSKSFASMFQGIRESGAFFDIDELRSRHDTWGEHGWVLFDDMTGEVSRMRPQSWVEANKIARGCIKSDTVVELFERLRESVAKRNDLEEAIALFEERR